MTVCDKRDSYFAAQTAYLQYNPRLAVKLHKASSHTSSIVLHGSKKSKITIGRGHKNGVLVGRNNPRMSRQHLVIEHKPHTGFILTVQSPNGALVDHIMFTAGEHVPLVKGTLIEVLGTSLIFAGEQEEQPQHEKEKEGNESDQCSTSTSSSTTDTTTAITISVHEKEGKKENNITNESNLSSIKIFSPPASSTTAINNNNNNHSNHNNNNLMDTTNTTKLSIATTPNQPSSPSSPSSSSSSNLASSSTLLSSASSSSSSTSSESTLISNSPIELDFSDTLIRLLATSRKTSMTISEICKQLKRERNQVNDLVDTVECIGCIERKGNTADGKPKEHLYYYQPELDKNDTRRNQLSQLKKGARKCALKDTQYYFKIPPKLPSHRTKASSLDQQNNDGQLKEKTTNVKNNVRLSSSLSTSASTTTTGLRSKKKRKTKRQGSSNNNIEDDDHQKENTTTTNANTIMEEEMASTATSPSSLFSDDDDGFLSSEDECSEKEMTALFQDI
ncbi:hypothetical protein BJ944DRAFT_260279 [Cunninghamella echinulata]|nr:hypothetical protein BJ944DRAFT_260279 [Cunninghamella echinulata]